MEAPRHLSEPWFSLVATGQKVREGRLGNNSMGAVPVGTRIIFYNDDLGRRRETRVAVTKKELFSSFREMLSSSDSALAKTLPTVRSVEDGVAVYRKFYSAGSEKKHGVVAISIKRASDSAAPARSARSRASARSRS
jgi:ASC-1-like (ASCH) protein